MRDRISTKILDNGATRYGVYDEDGNLLRYEYIKLEDEPDEEGDFFNKASMLPDHIPALLGLKMGNPQVKDALNVLANIGNVHVWDKVSIAESYIVDAAVNETTLTYGETIYYSKALSVSGGVVSLVSPSSFVFTGATSETKLLEGMFFYTGANAAISLGVGWAWQEAPYVGFSICRVSAVASNTHIDFVTSTDSAAYPQDGDVGDYHYTYLGHLGEPGAKVAFRTWVGTGTYGASNPTVFELDFEPLLAFTYYDADSTLLDDAVGRMAAAIPLFLLPKDNEYYAGFNLTTDHNDTAFAKKSTDGKTIFFYNTRSATSQANTANWQHGILFIG